MEIIIKSRNLRPCSLRQISEAKKLGSTQKGGFFAESLVVRGSAGEPRHPVLKGIRKEISAKPR